MDRGKALAALIWVLLAGGLLVLLLTAVPSPQSEAVESPWIGPWLWEVRGVDLAVQALLILAGVLGVLLVLETGREGA